MDYAIITGASKGLGEAIAESFLKKGFHVFAVSRNESSRLSMASGESKGIYSFTYCDLSSPESIRTAMEEISEEVFKDAANRVFLINNAGVIGPIDTVGNFPDPDVLQHVQVNLSAPILISNLFLKKAEEKGVPLTITNVTSGAGERPVHGWSLYCSTKAAVNMFTQTAALELSNKGSLSSIIAYSPGIMDTGMQETIRSSSEQAFEEVNKFREYKEQNKLRSPHTVGEALVGLLLNGDCENGRIYYVNELL